jgi:hypothetical protein
MRTTELHAFSSVSLASAVSKANKELAKLASRRPELKAMEFAIRPEAGPAASMPEYVVMIGIELNAPAEDIGDGPLMVTSDDDDE